MNRVFTAIYELGKQNKKGITVSDINRYLGENRANLMIFVREIRKLLRQKYIVECGTERCAIHLKRFTVTELGEIMYIYAKQI